VVLLPLATGRGAISRYRSVVLLTSLASSKHSCWQRFVDEVVRDLSALLNFILVWIIVNHILYLAFYQRLDVFMIAYIYNKFIGLLRFDVTLYRAAFWSRRYAWRLKTAAKNDHFS
jgi:hypothetical protein